MRRSALYGTAAILSVWALVTYSGVVSRLFLPTPSAVMSALVALTSSGAVIGDTWSTLWRTLIGFVSGGTIGVLVGLFMGRYPRLLETMELPLDFFRSIPATALFPLFIVLLGLGDGVKVVVAGWAVALVVALNTMYGIRSVSTTRIQLARLRGWGVWTTFLRVMIPDSAPHIAVGLRIGLSLALVVQVVAEMFLGSTNGLGRRIFNATSIFEMEEAYATIFVVGLLGYLMNKAISTLEQRVVHWERT